MRGLCFLIESQGIRETKRDRLVNNGEKIGYPYGDNY
jgi:hypothetical protein